MSSSITDRIIQTSGYPGLVDWLAGLPGDDFQSLLLEIFHRRAQQLTARDLLRAYEQNRFVGPSRVAPELLLELDQLAYGMRGPFECLEFSPLAPLGACSALATVHQHKVVSALRHTEAVSDATNLLALEIARRRRSLRCGSADRTKAVHLLCSQRVARAQYFDNPQFSAHFRILSLCSGGRDTGSLAFERQNLALHLQFYLRFLTESLALGYRPGPLAVRFSDYTGGPFADVLAPAVMASLRETFPDVECFFHENPTSGRGYYQNFRFQIELTGPDGIPLPLIDGGDTDWTRQLLSDRKERLLTSAMGTQLYAQVFRWAPLASALP